MTLDDFLEAQGIDLSQVVCYHYSENSKGETPVDGIDIDLEALMEEYAEAKSGHHETLVMRTGYLCQVGGTMCFVLAENVADAMDRLERTSKGEDYRMTIHHSIPVVVDA